MSKVSTDHLASERQAEIRHRLAGASGVIASDLAREFSVSEDTIRRDLRALAKSGDCIRVHGGALPVVAKERSLAERMSSDTEVKSRLAACMAGLLLPGQSIFIDAGSTGLVFAKFLPAHRATRTVNVFTHAPHIAAALMDNPAVNLFVIGGKVDRNVGAAIGSQALRELERIRPDVAIIGACAMDSVAGISAFDADDAEFKKALAHACTTRIIAATDDKVGTVAPFPFLPVAEATHLIVSKTLAPHKLVELQRSGAQIHIA